MFLDCYISLQKFQMCVVIYMIPFQSAYWSPTPGSGTNPLITSSCPLQSVSPTTDRFSPQTQLPSCQLSAPNSSMAPQCLLSYTYIINSGIHCPPQRDANLLIYFCLPLVSLQKNRSLFLLFFHPMSPMFFCFCTDSHISFQLDTISTCWTAIHP